MPAATVRAKPLGWDSGQFLAKRFAYKHPLLRHELLTDHLSSAALPYGTAPSIHGLRRQAPSDAGVVSHSAGLRLEP